MHVVEIVDEIVIWDKFVINELTLLVDNRVHDEFEMGVIMLSSSGLA